VVRSSLNMCWRVPQVYDYDWAFRDDFMGEVTVSLVRLEVDKSKNILVSLGDVHSSEYLGQVELGLRLQPKRGSDDAEVTSLTNDRSSLSESVADSAMPIKAASGSGGAAAVDAPAKRPRGQSPWSAVVNVVLVEGRDLLAMDFEGTSDPYCKFR
jgi:Ca2+-dependent lipid-binding protein